MTATIIGHPAALRFEFQALLDYCYRTVAPDEDDYAGGRTEAQMRQAPLAASTIARLLGVNRTEVHRLISVGTIGCEAADRYATRLGLHPIELWPTFHDLCPDELDMEGW